MSVSMVDRGDTSEAFRADCEARHVLRKNYASRDEFMALVKQRRGESSQKALADRCRTIEPSYVLDLPNKFQRQDYLASMAFRYGDAVADRLKAAVLALHEKRKLAAGRS